MSNSILIVVPLLSALVSAETEKEIKIRPGYDLKRNLVHARATLKTNVKENQVGESVEIEIRFDVLKGGGRFHNLLLSSSSPKSAILAVFDEHGTYIGDAFEYRLGRGVLHKPKWTEVNINTYIGHRRSIAPGRPPVRNFDFGPTLPKLKPGSYRFQLIYLQRFIEFHKGISIEQQEKELFRSNIVELQLLPKESNKCNSSSSKK